MLLFGLWGGSDHSNVCKMSSSQAQITLSSASLLDTPPRKKSQIRKYI